MARITRVKSAQQRYETKPVLDAEGRPVKIALTRKDGSPKMTSGKRGKTPRPVFITKTERDLTRPKPNLRCDFPGCDIDNREILPGSAYMWIKPKTGPYGGHQRNRHAQHPAWNVWDYSSSLSARVAQIEHNALSESFDNEEDAASVLSNAAEEIRSLAEEKRESAGNIEDGFGHATYQSEELESQADELDAWADEVEQTDIPSMDDYRSGDQVDCDECNGTGQVDNEDYDEEDDESEPEVDCDECGGTGQVDPQGDEDLTEDEMADWVSAVEDVISEALGNCPV